MNCDWSIRRQTLEELSLYVGATFDQEGWYEEKGDWALVIRDAPDAGMFELRVWNGRHPRIEIQRALDLPVFHR